MTSRKPRAAVRDRFCAAAPHLASRVTTRGAGSWPPAPRLFKSALHRVDRRVQRLILRCAPRIECRHAGTPLRVVGDPQIFDRDQPTRETATVHLAAREQRGAILEIAHRPGQGVTQAIESRKRRHRLQRRRGRRRCGGRRGWRGLRTRARRPVARLRTAGRRWLRPAGHQLLRPIDQTCPGQRLRRIPDLYIPIRAGTNPRQQQQEHEPLGPGAAPLAPARVGCRLLLLLLLEQPKRVCRRATRPRRSGSRNLRRNRSHRLRRDLPRDVIRRARRWRRCWCRGSRPRQGRVSG